jgi:outer membrane receptor protein involved in Fe transport
LTALRPSIAACAAIFAGPAFAQTQPATDSVMSQAQNPKSPEQPEGQPEQSIVVVGTKRNVQSADGKTYDQTSNRTAETGSAADVLNTVPSVHVTPDGAVTLRGSQNVEVLVNGKRSAATSGEGRGLTLQSMTGSDIASIEVVTNPSAKYGSTGGGIINIVLKKNRQPGARGVLTANVGAHRRANGSLNASHTVDDLSLNMILGGRNDFRRYEEETSTRTRDGLGGFASRREQSRSFNARRLASTLIAGADYQLSEQTTVGTEISRKANRASNPITELNRRFDESDSLLEDYARVSRGPRSNVETGINVNVRHLGRTSDWRLAFQDTWVRDRRDKTYRDTYSFPNVGEDAVRVLTKAAQRVSRVTGDGVIGLGSGSQLSMGFDLQRVSGEFTNLNAGIDPLGGGESVNSELTSEVGVTRTIRGAYATYQRPFGALIVLAGLRLETARTDVDLLDAGDRRSRTDTNLNPSLHLKYALGDDREITANISQISQRPDLTNLNPRFVYVDSENLTSGNADLRPQRITSAELGYASKLGKLDQTVTAYYRRSRDTVTDFSTLAEKNVLLTTKRNAGRGRSAGAVYTLSGDLTPKLNLNLSANLFYAEVEALDVVGNLKNSGFSYGFESALDYELTDKDQLHLDVNWGADTITAQGYRTGTRLLNASWSHRFTPRFSLNLRVNDFTDGSVARSTIETSAVSRRSRSYIRGRVAFGGIQYRFQPRPIAKRPQRAPG